MKETEEVKQAEISESRVSVEKKGDSFDGCLKFGCASVLAPIILLIITSGEETVKDDGAHWSFIFVKSFVATCLVYLMLYITDGLSNKRRKSVNDKPKKKLKDRIIIELFKFMKIFSVFLVISFIMFFILMVSYL